MQWNIPSFTENEGKTRFLDIDIYKRGLVSQRRTHVDGLEMVFDQESTNGYPETIEEPLDQGKMSVVVELKPLSPLSRIDTDQALRGERLNWNMMSSSWNFPWGD